MPSDYQLFVKKHMLAMRDSDMKATDKMKHIAMLWQEHKHKHTSSESSIEDSSEDEEPKPRKPAKKSNTKRKTNKDIDLSELLKLLK